MKPMCLCVVGASALLSNVALGQSLSDRLAHVRQVQTEKAAARSQSNAALLGGLLYTDMSVAFDETPVRDAIDYIKTVTNLPIVARYNDDRIGIGLDARATITFSAQNKPAITILEMLLDQASDLEGATWQLRDGYIEVGTKDRLAARSAQEIRYYPIRDLLFEPPMFDNAPELDLESALNQGNNQGGGGGGGGGGGFGGGGGGGGGFGGGGGGGGTGGSLFGTPGDDPTRMTEAERAQQIVDIITQTVEPDGWDILGGNWATIRYYQGTLIIRAPDFIHRQIGGYPFAPQPRSQRISSTERRYLTFTGGATSVQLTNLRTSPNSGGSNGSATSGSTSTVGNGTVQKP